jgi:hypothetical protein
MIIIISDGKCNNITFLNQIYEIYYLQNETMMIQSSKQISLTFVRMYVQRTNTAQSQKEILTTFSSISSNPSHHPSSSKIIIFNQHKI